MGFFDKIMFWKKKDDLEEPDDPFAAKDAGMGGGDPFAKPAGGMPEDVFAKKPIEGAPAGPSGKAGGYEGLESKPPIAAVQPSQASGGREMELVLARLDAIRTSLENINMRLERIERLARSEEEVNR